MKSPAVLGSTTSAADGGHLHNVRAQVQGTGGHNVVGDLQDLVGDLQEKQGSTEVVWRLRCVGCWHEHYMP